MQDSHRKPEGLITGPLDIFLPQDFSSLQRANLSDISQRLKVVRLRHL